MILAVLMVPVEQLGRGLISIPAAGHAYTWPWGCLPFEGNCHNHFSYCWMSGKTGETILRNTEGLVFNKHK